MIKVESRHFKLVEGTVDVTLLDALSDVLAEIDARGPEVLRLVWPITIDVSLFASDPEEERFKFRANIKGAAEECELPAEWVLLGSAPTAFVHACTDHVSALIDDNTNQIVPYRPADDPEYKGDHAQCCYLGLRLAEDVLLAIRKVHGPASHVQVEVEEEGEG